MSGETNLTKLITSMTPELSDSEFVFVSLDKPEADFVASVQPVGTFREEEGLTLILLKHKAEQYNVKYSGLFRCITLKVHSSLDAVGLTAAVATKLTQYNISANVVAAFYHDHIFVAATDAKRALQALVELSKDGM
jgi:hypothetical protein